MTTDLSFGGKVIVYCCDIRKLQLHVNERVRQNGNSLSDHEFSELVLNICNDTVPHPNIPIRIPDRYIFNSPGWHDFVLDCYLYISD